MRGDEVTVGVGGRGEPTGLLEVEEEVLGSSPLASLHIRLRLVLAADCGGPPHESKKIDGQNAAERSSGSLEG